MKGYGKKIGLTLIIFVVFGTAFFVPKIFIWTVQFEQEYVATNATEQFPVTVDPRRKVINQNDQVDAFLAVNHSLFEAAVINTENALRNIFEGFITSIANAQWYQNTASVNGRLVLIKPGLRKEQVANVFANALGWNSKQKQIFTATGSSTPSLLSEGLFAPGTYFVSFGTTPEGVREMMNNRFIEDILSHYGTSTQAVVPLKDALIMASLIQRETVGTDGMRLISGIMWNRLFSDMNLQIDATLQYAKANKTKTGEWWPDVYPRDKYIKSPYNTYLNKGLPPTPIASPSVAAVLAALNPVETPCLFYFNDPKGEIHCSETYKEHTKLLKQYYKN